MRLYEKCVKKKKAPKIHIVLTASVKLPSLASVAQVNPNCKENSVLQAKSQVQVAFDKTFNIDKTRKLLKLLTKLILISNSCPN